MRARFAWPFLFSGLFVPAAATAGPGSDAALPRGARVVDDAPYSREFREKVNASVVHGVAFLRAHQAKDGSFGAFGEFEGGPTALAVLALLAAGVSGDDAAVAAAFAFLRRRRGDSTYEAGALLMALAAKYDPFADPFAADDADEAGRRRARARLARKIPDADRAWARERAEFLVTHQAKGRPVPVDGVPVDVRKNAGAWGYPGPNLEGADASNTQFALLGLDAAKRLGVQVPPATWRKALARLLAWQAAKGPEASVSLDEERGRKRVMWSEAGRARGFAYVSDWNADYCSGSMTQAGAACLMLCLSALEEDAETTPATRAAAREGVRDAIAWMQSRFSVSKNPGYDATNGAWHSYHRYGLERMGTLARLRFLGSHDWYLEGAQWILGRQDKDGAWGGIGEIDTSFALLFLRRATVRLERPVTTPRDPPPADGTKPPETGK